MTGYLSYRVELVDWFSMMRKFIFVYSNVEIIRKIVCGNEGAIFLELNWVFCLGLGLNYYLDF